MTTAADHNIHRSSSTSTTTRSNSSVGVGITTTQHDDAVGVVIETNRPIGPRGIPPGVCALAIGLFLALHTPAWVVLVSYRETIRESTETTSILFLRFLSRWLLEFTPWFANAVLSVFLGVLFLHLGRATLLERSGS
mmetsp:Transcript_113768/g.232775  ORF Transcript_113768/g.232775 Transcript_113768/m.232775 type:complete len:137 (-) Transcript_113768:675-1085(-)